ncbi:hypothetical protein ACT79_06605 [Burkholderia pseudomallei]|nr:hypothetical protein ACT79_06605 [Burkholderia pseudomallei]
MRRPCDGRYAIRDTRRAPRAARAPRVDGGACARVRAPLPPLERDRRGCAERCAPAVARRGGGAACRAVCRPRAGFRAKTRSTDYNANKEDST